VLTHLFSPLHALDRLATLCRRQLIVSHPVIETHDGRPILLYVAGDRANDENRSWWLPSQSFLEQVLRKVGFRTVEVVGRHQGVIRRVWKVWKRIVIHATK
jgi:hypothetical protein